MRAPVAPRTLLLGVAAVCGLSVGLALLAQHRFDMQPCPWCILQRLLFVLITVVALLGALVPAAVQRLSAVTAAVLIDIAAGLGATAALYQHLVASKSASCAQTLADKVISGLGLDRAMPEVFEVRATCADAAVSVAGVPFELWSLLLFVLVGLSAGVTLIIALRQR